MDKKNLKKMSSLLQSGNIQNDKYQLINIDDIVLDENQPRKLFDKESIKELSQSISQYGVLTPVSVSQQDDGKFILRHGERRYRASKLAGLDKIPAIIDDEYSHNKLIKQLIENIQRENLSMDEIADAISTLYNNENMSLVEIASALGKSNAYVSNFYNYSILEQPLKDKLLTKTNDILVISEFNRILKKINKTKNNNLKKLLENTYYEFIGKTPTLNRGSVNSLKTVLENLENSFNEREELREEYANNTDNTDMQADNEEYFQHPLTVEAKDDYIIEPAANKLETEDDSDYFGEAEFDSKDEIIYNNYSLSNEPRIEIVKDCIYYCSERGKFPLIKIMDKMITDNIQDDIVAVIKEKLNI